MGCGAWTESSYESYGFGDGQCDEEDFDFTTKNSSSKVGADGCRNDREVVAVEPRVGEDGATEKGGK